MFAVARLITIALCAAILAGGAGWAVAAPAIGGCNTAACEQRVKARALQHRYQLAWRAAPSAVRAHLRRIAMCESTNNERAISPDGRYRGLLQFWTPTWQAMGGRRDPAAATRWEQWARGVRLYQSAGPGQWPVCQFR